MAKKWIIALCPFPRRSTTTSARLLHQYRQLAATPQQRNGHAITSRKIWCFAVADPGSVAERCGRRGATKSGLRRGCPRTRPPEWPEAPPETRHIGVAMPTAQKSHRCALWGRGGGKSGSGRGQPGAQSIALNMDAASGWSSANSLR